jgi:hypothetical protein
MDRYDILGMLNGENILSLDTEGIEKVEFQEIIEGMMLHYEQVKKHGKDSYIVSLQREGGFSAFENDAAGLVAGFEIDTLKIRRMPEKTLRLWIIGYLEMLSRERRKAEKTIIFKGRHGGF